MSYIDSYEDVMDLEEEMLRYSFTKLKENYGDKIKEVYGEDINLPKDKFPKVRLKELYDILEKDYNLKVNEEDKVDLNAEAEKLAGIYAKEKFNSDFIFIIDFPAEKRAFYHMRNDEGQLMGYDLLYKGVEITSGAQREHRYDKLAKIVKEKGIENDVKFYLEFFKYGCPPHGGFAIGLDRLTMLLLNIPSVKESMFLFRGPGRLDP
jgi:aspartyl-tRNA synthetase